MTPSGGPDCQSLRIGLFGIGLDTYWPQFAGLKERLEGYLRRVAQKLALPGVEVVNLGLVDTPENGLCYYQEAKDRNIELVLGKDVSLTYDTECEDRYGRLLAYVETKDADVNKTLLKEGFARVLHIAPNGSRLEEMEEAELYAQQRGLGVWSCDPSPYE